MGDQVRFDFVKELVSACSEPFELIPDRTGFIDIGAFATYGEIIYADGRTQPIPQLDLQARSAISDVQGTATGATRVLRLARHSTYLAFGIGVALASPLPTYLKLRRDGTSAEMDHLTETAVINFSGRSSSGKSSVLRTAVSLAGAPDRAGSLDFTSRGLAEIASDSNDLVLGLDDTEKAEDAPGVLVKALKGIVHTVPGGRSKIISRGVDQSRFPRLRWSTFGLSSSPKPISQLAAENGWNMTRGDQVRLFNIRVPSSKKGGIFDLINGTAAVRAKRSVDLIAKLERGYQNHHGHVIPAWILHLMAEDRSQQILTLVDQFIDHVKGKSDGWETRFARKFGYIYAAMVIGIEAGLLPWHPQLPLEVVTRCHRKARRAASSENERFAETAAKLSRALRKPGRVIDGTIGRRTITVTKRCVAIRYLKNGKRRIGVLDDALLKLLGTPKAKTAFTKGLTTAGVVREGHGHAGTVQERINIMRNGKVSDRVRLWSIDAEKFLHLTKNEGAGRKTRR